MALLVTGAVVSARDGGGDAEVAAGLGAPARRPARSLPPGGFVLARAAPSPPPGFDATSVTAQVWVGPGRGAARPGVLVLATRGPRGSWAWAAGSRDAVTVGDPADLVRGHPSEDLVADDPSFPADAGRLWVEEPGLAITVAVRDTDAASSSPWPRPCRWATAR